MNIKTITCHDVYNYGASLQAYALQEYLISQGHNVEIIDYKPDYMRVHYDFWYVPKNSHYYKMAMNSKLIHFMLCCYFAPHRFATYGRKKKFDAFKEKFLKCTRRYNSFEELAADAPVADAYFAGSDQIWNSNLPNGKDPGYFLQFGKENTKRIAYAASFGIPEIQPEHRPLMSKWLEKFDAISVREKSALNILDTLNAKGINVVDPVFLLTKEQWSKFAGEQRMIKEKYILVYDLDLSNEDLKIEAKRLNALYGYRIVAVNGLAKCPYAHKSINNAGPQEFLNLIKNAEFVISNSFHATSFCVIFNKRFATFYKHKNISRMADLLECVGLKDSLNAQEPKYEYNWDKVNEKLVEMCALSYDYIRKNTK